MADFAFCELFNSEAFIVVLYTKKKVILLPTSAYTTHSKKTKSEEIVRKNVNILYYFCSVNSALISMKFDMQMNTIPKKECLRIIVALILPPLCFLY